eukprot:scaffold35693_cov66-Phaeocystis_antarctica.AAC.2
MPCVTVPVLREQPPPQTPARRSSSTLAPSCPKQGRRSPQCSDAPRRRARQRHRACHPPLRRRAPVE